MTWTRYENEVFPGSPSIEGDEAVIYSVLLAILQRPCARILALGEDALACLSERPYPVWVWAREGADGDAIRALAARLRAEFPLEEGFRWNLSRALLARLAAADPALSRARVAMELLAYRLDALLPPPRPCGGRLALARPEQAEALARLEYDAAREMNDMGLSFGHFRERVAEQLARDALFVWLDEAGGVVSTAFTADAGRPGCVKISGVYTLPEKRRRGYAMHLMHGISQKIIEDGQTPILYTDANYAASNACYRKLGYRELGGLLTVGALSAQDSSANAAYAETARQR